MKKIHQAIRHEDLNSQWLDFIAEQKISPEIYFQANELDTLSQDQILNLEKNLHERNLIPALHAPFLDLSPGAFDVRIRSVTRERIEQVFQLAEVLKPSHIICHAQYERHRFGSRIAEWVENSAQTFEPLVRRAEKMKIALVIEDSFEDDPTPLNQLIEKIASPSFRSCFDNGHFHVHHKVSLKKWWEIIGDKTVLLHLHDNHGEKDEHLPLGEGNFPFPAFFNLLKDYRHDMTYTLESTSLDDAQKSLKTLRRFLDGKI